MFENLLRNIRDTGQFMMKYSWVLGLFLAVVYLLFGGLEALAISVIIGIFVWLKWLFIGFIITIICDLFLVNPEDEV